MDNKSATTAEAAPIVTEATTHLDDTETTAEAAPIVTEATTHLDDTEKHKKDANDEKISDVMEMLQGLAGRLQKMEEKMDSRLQKMEEKMDLLISSISVKAEAENMSIDESSFGQESDEKHSDDRFGHSLFGPDRRRYERFDHFSDGPDRRSYEYFVRGQQQTYDGSRRVSGGPGRGQGTDDSFGRFFNGGGQYNDDRFGPFFNGRGRGLHVGGRFAGGRCGGQGFCGHC